MTKPLDYFDASAPAAQDDPARHGLTGLSRRGTEASLRKALDDLDELVT